MQLVPFIWIYLEYTNPAFRSSSKAVHPAEAPRAGPLHAAARHGPTAPGRARVGRGSGRAVGDGQDPRAARMFGPFGKDEGTAKLMKIGWRCWKHEEDVNIGLLGKEN